MDQDPMMPEPADVNVSIDFNRTQAEKTPLVDTGATELVSVPMPKAIQAHEVAGVWRSILE